MPKLLNLDENWAFFLVIDLSNYRLSKRQIKKIIEYRLSDNEIKLSNYRLSDIKKIIGCPPLMASASKYCMTFS
jgi:hypothetical protein